jgi:hypothetical protein
MRCEAQKTTRGTGRCRMQAAPGKTLCRYHDPELKPATMAELKRKQSAYWDAYRRSRQNDVGSRGETASKAIRSREAKRRSNPQ